jgi:hypothetical protein
VKMEDRPELRIERLRIKVEGKANWELGIRKKENFTSEIHGRAQIKEVGSGTRRRPKRMGLCRGKHAASGPEGPMPTPRRECGKTESVEVGKDRWWDGVRRKVKE